MLSRLEGKELKLKLEYVVEKIVDKLDVLSAIDRDVSAGACALEPEATALEEAMGSRKAKLEEMKASNDSMGQETSGLRVGMEGAETRVLLTSKRPGAAHAGAGASKCMHSRSLLVLP